MNDNRSNYSFIGAGSGNTIYSASTFAFIGAGSDNIIYNAPSPADSSYASILGGSNNRIGQRARYSLIASGFDNAITGATSGSLYSAILAGLSNTLLGETAGSVILGGDYNTLGSSGETSLYSLLYGRNNNGFTSNSIVLGQFNQFSGNSINVIGDNNILNGSLGNILGSNNTYTNTPTERVYIVGHNNTIDTFGGGIFGNHNVLSGTNTYIVGHNLTGVTEDTLYTNKVKSIYGISNGTLDVTGVVASNYTELASPITTNGYTILGNVNIARPYGLTANSGARYIGSYNAAYWNRDTAYDLTLSEGAALVGVDGAVAIDVSASTTINRINGVRSSLYSKVSGVTIEEARFFTCNNPNTEALGSAYGMQSVHGFHMEPFSICAGYTAGTTDLWGVYIDDINAKNYLGGNTYIGTSVGTARLHVVGTGSTGVAMAVESGNVGIGTSTPYSGALVDLQSTTQALVITRMTSTQASAITPTNGMMLYVTDTNVTFTSKGFWGYEEGVWVKL